MFFLIYTQVHFFYIRKFTRIFLKLFLKKQIESVNDFARYSQKTAKCVPRTTKATHAYRVGVGGEISSMTLTNGKHAAPSRGAAPH